MGLINGPYGKAQILSLDQRGVRVCWDPDLESPPLYPVELVVGQVRPICMKRILREATSLGVRAIHVIGADTAERSYRSSHLWTKGEYREYLIHGAVQAVSTLLPECHLYDRVDDLQTTHAKSLVMLDNIDPEKELMRLEGLCSPLMLAIGPERGWSQRERLLLESRGFIRAGMGQRVLRTETACTAGLALVLGRLGLM